MSTNTSEKLTQSDKSTLLLWGVSILTLIIWHLPFLRDIRYPFMLLGTWFHEMGHGLTALLVGGSFEYLEIFASGSGLAHVRGSSGFLGAELNGALISLGGLLGPSIAGSIMIISGRRKSWSTVVLCLLAGMILLSVIVWVRTVLGIAILTAVGIGILAIAWKGKPRWKQIAMQFLGVQAALSTYLQIDYLFTPKAVIGGIEYDSDISNIANNTFGHYTIWGTAITILTVGLILLSFRIATRERLFFEKKV